jgi:hypothetical protein
MRAWLEERRRTPGDELKKALRPAVAQIFGDAFRQC